MGSRRLRCWISPLGLRPLFAIQHHSATNRYFSVNYCRLLLQFASKKFFKKCPELLNDSDKLQTLFIEFLKEYIERQVS